MNVHLGAAEPVRATLVVRQFETSLFSYLWRCVRSARYVPSIGSKFLLTLHHATILGWWWLVIRAVLPTLGMIAILQHVPSLKPASIPYGLYVISGMVVWTVLTNGLNRGTRALKQSRGIYMKLAVPKLVFLISSGSIAAFFSAVFAIVLAIIIAYYYISSGTLYLKAGWPLLLAPIPLLVCFILSIGIASFTSLIFLFARDARLVLSVVTQFWFYFTPIIYALDILPSGWQWAILYLNPATSLVELFRWSLFQVGDWTIMSLACSISITLAFFLLGAWFLMRSEWVVREVM